MNIFKIKIIFVASEICCNFYSCLHLNVKKKCQLKKKKKVIFVIGFGILD